MPADPFLEQMHSRLLAHAGALDEVRQLLREHSWAQLEIGCAVADLREAAKRLPVAEAALAAPDEGRAWPTCATCHRPATCLGVYEDPRGEPRFACDTCCGHGQEDGHCYRLPAAPASPEPRDDGLSDLRRDAVELGDRLYSRMTPNERDFFNSRIRAASPEPEGERAGGCQHTNTTGHLNGNTGMASWRCNQCGLTWPPGPLGASPPSPAPRVGKDAPCYMTHSTIGQECGICGTRAPSPAPRSPPASPEPREPGPLRQALQSIVERLTPGHTAGGPCSACMALGDAQAALAASPEPEGERRVHCGYAGCGNLADDEDGLCAGCRARMAPGGEDYEGDAPASPPSPAPEAAPDGRCSVCKERSPHLDKMPTGEWVCPCCHKGCEACNGGQPRWPTDHPRAPAPSPAAPAAKEDKP